MPRTLRVEPSRNDLLPLLTTPDICRLFAVSPGTVTPLAAAGAFAARRAPDRRAEASLPGGGLPRADGAHKRHKGPAGGRTAWRVGWAAPVNPSVRRGRAGSKGVQGREMRVAIAVAFWAESAVIGARW